MVPRVIGDRPPLWMRAPWAFALVVIVGYGLLALPILTRRGFDSSVFIGAGAKFVDPSQLISPIIVQNHTNGYDGQFYYRLALAPFRLEQPAFGILFDSPPWRMQRIAYPLMVWGVTFGHAALVPVGMFLVNLLGLGAIAIFAVRLTARLHLPVQMPIAIIFWPGFIITLTHDTTEIVAVALLVGALDSYLAKRLVAYGVLGALATLTRETSILVLGGVTCFEIIRAVRGRAALRNWHRVMICGLALLPFLVWRHVLYLVWGQSPQESAGYQNISWPFLGAATMLRDTLIGVRSFAPIHGESVAMRTYELCSALWLLAFCAVVATRVLVALRVANTTGALAAGWLPVFFLMSVLSADGPWVDPFAYFRAFTECYVVGCLVLALRPMPRWSCVAMFAGGAFAFIGAWGLSVIVLGYGT